MTVDTVCGETCCRAQDREFEENAAFSTCSGDQCTHFACACTGADQLMTVADE